MARTRRLPLVLLLISGLAGVVSGQVWRGPGALGVKVADQRGKAVAGAEVVLRLRGRLGAGEGPPTATTDGKGQLTLANIAEGIWELEISHPEFMSFFAVVRIEEGGKAEALEASHHATAGGGGPLRIKFFKAKADPNLLYERVVQDPRRRTEPSPEPAPTPEPQVRPVAPPELPPAPPTPEPEPSAPPMAPEGAPPTEPAVAAEPLAMEPPTPTAPPTEPRESLPVESPPTGAEPSEPAPTGPAAAEAVGETPAQPTSVEQPVVAPEPASPAPPADAPPVAEGPVAEPPPATDVRDAAPPTAPDETTSAAPAPAPAEAAPAPVSLPEPAPAAPSVAQLVPIARSLRSANDGTCFDCKPGEAAVTAEVLAGPAGAGAGCTAPGRETLAEVLRRVAADGSVGGGALIDGLSRVPRGLPPELSGDAAAALAPFSGRCAVVVAVIPQGGRYTGYAYGARDAGGVGGCLSTQECQIGDSRWFGDPVVERGAATVVYGFFENAATVERLASLTVYFKPGRDR